MVNKYWSHISVLVILTAALELPNVLCEPTLDVVYCPDSLQFSESEPIRGSSLADLLSSAMGYTLPKPLEWKGLTAITDVFSLPKASITLRINGQLSMNSMHKFPIVEIQSLDNQFDVLSERTQQRFSDNNRIIVKMDYQKDIYNDIIIDNKLVIPELSESSDQRLSTALQNKDLRRFVDDNALDINDSNIKGLVLEIATIRQIIESLRKSKVSDKNFGSIRTILWFDVKSFGPIIEDNKYDQSVKEGAKQLITNLIEELTQYLRHIYDNRVIFNVIEDQSMSKILFRKVRQTDNSKESNKNETSLNLAHEFDPNFHTAFAMIGFTTILIAVSVFGISVSMWNLDPGKDSIIYRMTSQRIKKDQ